MALASNCESFTPHLHTFYFDLPLICSNIRSLNLFHSFFFTYIRKHTHSFSLLFALAFSFSLTLSLPFFLLAIIKQLCCPSCALILTCTFIRFLSFTPSLGLARSLVSLLNVRISCQIIYLVFFVLFFVYSVCLYSYNNHFPNDYTLNSSNFLHFFTNNNWIVAPNFLSAHFFVIEFAIVFIAVSMHSAKQSSTTALET